VTGAEIKSLTQQTFQQFSMAMFEANDPLGVCQSTDLGLTS